MTTDYSNPKNRFIEWTADDSITDAMEFDTRRLHQCLDDAIKSFISEEMRRLEPAIDDAVSGNVNQAVSEAITELEILPAAKPDAIGLRFLGNGPAEIFSRTVSAEDICAALDDYENGAETASDLADRLETIAQALRTYRFSD